MKSKFRCMLTKYSEGWKNVAVANQLSNVVSHIHVHVHIL